MRARSCRFANSGFGHFATPSPSFLFPLPFLIPFPQGPHPLNQLGVLGERCKLPQWGLGQSPSRQTIWCISEPKGAALVATVFVHFHNNKFKLMYKHKNQVKSSVTDKHNTKYNTLISEQPYIHARWWVFTFPGQNEPCPGHGTVHHGSIPGQSRPFRDGWQA